MKHKTTNILRLTNVARQNIQREKLFQFWQNLLITFSGGQDSTFCLLILYLLKKKSQEKVPFYACPTFLKASFIKTKRKNNLLWHNKDQITKFYLNLSYITTYTLLWCHHFWQRDAFFTMEHVSKLAFAKKYTIHLFAPVQQIMSEQKARYWRHKIMQRSSFFVCQPRFCYELQQSSKKRKRVKQEFTDGIAQVKSAFTNKITTGFAHNWLAQATPVLAKAELINFGYKVQSAKCIAFFCTKASSVHPPIVQHPECMSLFRAHVPSKLKSGQFVSLFLNFVLLARPFLVTLTEKQSSSLVNHIGQNDITKTTFGLSEFLCVQGHNKSDRAEAILFNLIRGAGINGISTLQWKQSLNTALFCYSSNKSQSYCPNDVFYPIFSDFLKEVPIIYLDILGCQKEKLKKKTDNRNHFLRLAILQKTNFQECYFYSRVQQNSYNRQSKAVDFEKRNYNYKGKFGAMNQLCLYRSLPLWNFKRFVKKKMNEKYYYSKEATIYYKRTNLHRIKATKFDQQNKINIKTFYYQLKYKESMFFISKKSK